MRIAVSLLLTMGLAVTALAQRVNPDDAYRALRNDTSWVHPEMRNKLDVGQLETVAGTVRPYKLRVLAVPKLGSSWVKNGREVRDSFTKYVADKKIGQGRDGITILITNKGLSVYNPRLSSGTIDTLSRNAARLARPNNFTDAVVSLAENAKSSIASAGSTSSSAPARVGQTKSEGSLFGGFLCLAIPLGLVALGVILFKNAKKKEVQRSKAFADEVKQKSLQGIAHLDSYDGMLGDSMDASAVRQYRDRMAENYDSALATYNAAKTSQDYENAGRRFALVQQDFDVAKQHLEKITNGGVAYTIPPIIDNQRAPLFEPVQGVSYFSSMPANNLVPVEMNFGGTRKTVMVTPDERDQLMQGNVPQLRGQYNNGQFVPWYDVRGYDPYRDYGSGNFLWNMMAISALSNMFTPHYGYGWGGGLFGGGYHGGHYGGDHVTINNYGDSNSANDFGSGDFDFNSSDSGGGGGFDFGSGDFDFGGGDSGGDFGGGDFGGGGDF
jgi:hypothetical protein